MCWGQVVGDDRELGYRAKLSPHARPSSSDTSVTLGLGAVGGGLVDVARCALASEAVNAALGAERARRGCEPATFRRPTELFYF